MSAARPSARPPTASSPAHLAAPASCPVTRPIPHSAPPPQLHAINNFTFYLHGWYGNTALWVSVPVEGVLPAGRPYGTPWATTEWGTKFPWWPVIPGKFTITARRLDGPSAGFHSQAAHWAYPLGNGTGGFIPSGLYFPAPGCWQVTGTIAGHSLTLVAWVRTVPVVTAVQLGPPVTPRRQSERDQAAIPVSFDAGPTPAPHADLQNVGNPARGSTEPDFHSVV